MGNMCRSNAKDSEEQNHKDVIGIKVISPKNHKANVGSTDPVNNVANNLGDKSQTNEKSQHQDHVIEFDKQDKNKDKNKLQKSNKNINIKISHCIDSSEGQKNDDKINLSNNNQNVENNSNNQNNEKSLQNSEKKIQQKKGEGLLEISIDRPEDNFSKNVVVKNQIELKDDEDDAKKEELGTPQGLGKDLGKKFEGVVRELVKNHRAMIEAAYVKKFYLIDERKKNYNKETSEEREQRLVVDAYKFNLQDKIKQKFDLLVEEDNRRNFKIFDDDLNGGIEKKEFQQKFIDLGLDNDKELFAYIDMVFVKYDRDGNDRIDFNEFKVMCENERPFLNEELVDRVKYLYNKWDIDNDGNITVEELKDRFGKFNPNVIQEEIYQDILDTFDKDGNKTWDIEEFKLFLKYLGRNTHYLKHKKMKNFDSDQNMITEEIKMLIKKMESGLKEFEFLLGFIKPPKMVIVIVQLLLTLLFTDHTDVKNHIEVDVDNIETLKIWWENNIFWFQNPRRFIEHIIHFMEDFKLYMDERVFEDWYLAIRDWQVTQDPDILWNEQEAGEICKILEWFCLFNQYVWSAVHLYRENETEIE